MRVPIVKQRDFLIASIQSVLADDELAQLRDELSARVGRCRVRGVIIDVGGLDVIDSYATRTLDATAKILRLRGAKTVIVGIQPEVASTMAQLGLKLNGADTTRELEDGLARLSRPTERKL